MHKSYEQMCNFMSYYVMYVGPIIKKPFSPFKSTQFGRIANMWVQGKWFLPFLFISSMVTKQKKGLHICSFLFASSLLQPF